MAYKPVDTAIVVVVGPLIDNGDFKSVETAIAYDAAGMSLDWIQEKTDGTTVKTDLTLTTGGTSDWVHLGNGYYSVEITAAQNNEEGVGWVGGLCTGVLAFESPHYDIVPTAIYDALIKGTANFPANVKAISDDATAADNAEAAFDGGSYNVGGGGVVAASVTGAVGSVTGAVGSVTGAVGSVTAQVSADVTAISGDATAADNLEAQFDLTGLTGGAYPARQDQLSSLSSGSAAISVVSESFTATTVTVASGTYLNTQQRNAVYHQLQDVAGTLDCYYQFDIGADGVPAQITFFGRVNSVGDNVGVFAYNWAAAGWDQVGTLTGTALSTDAQSQFGMYISHVGTGANLGKVRIRFNATGLTTSNTYVDQVYVSYSVVRRTIGYSDGAIWIDTINGTAGTTAYTNGTADRPVSTLADALALSASVGVKRFRVANGSTITLVGATANYTFIGRNWNLALGGQAISGSYFEGAVVTGISSGASAVQFIDCEFGTVTVPAGSFIRCRLTSNSGGGFTSPSSGDYFFIQCASGIAGTNRPTITFSASVNVNFRAYSGGITLASMAAGNNASVEGFGNVVIDATCSGGTLVIRGTFQLTDSAGGAVAITDTARWNEDQNIANVTGAVTGSVGSVVGAVGSVTGAVGSVTGAVGSVTGNVGGNVVGSVASVTGAVGSVTGAVGSVTGNVGGNVTGSVGSVAAGGITAASIATGAIDADALATDAVAEIADGVWDEAIAGHLGAGSTGAALNAATAPSAATVADAVWDEAIAGHLGAGSTGAALNGATAPSAATVADAVWDEALAGHAGAGSAGAALSAAGASADPLLNPVPGAYAAGTAGWVLGRLEPGAGSLEFTYTLTNATTFLPEPNALVEFCTDAARLNVVWRGYTDTFGVARDTSNNKPWLDPGTYYIRVMKGADVNYDTEIVS